MGRRPFIRCGRHPGFFEALECRILLDGTDDLLDSLNDDLTDTLSNLPVVDNPVDTGSTDSSGNTYCGDNGVSTDTCGTDNTDYTDYANYTDYTDFTPVVSAPVRPSGVRAMRVSRTSIQLSWTQSDNNADGFTITRWGADGKHVVAQLTGDARSYVDGHLAAGRTYRYVITAYNQGGQADSAAVSASTAGDHLTVIQQPHTVTAGQTFSIGVDLRSAKNTRETFAPARMTISISGGPKGAVLGGTLTVAANAGVATFSGLSLTTAGTYSLSITDGLTVVSTRNFTVTADGSSAHLVLLSQANPGAIGKNLGLRFAVDDAFGNVVRSNSTVSLALTAGPGTLQGTLTAPVKNGVATFGRASLSAAGTFTLTSSDAQLAGDPLSFTQLVAKASIH